MSMKEAIKQAALKSAEVTKEGNAGKVEYSKDIFEETLPEKLTLETIKLVEDHKKDFVLGMLEAHGEKSVDLFSKDKGLEKITSSVKMGALRGNKLDLVTERKREFTNFLSEDRSKVVKHGYTTMAVQTSYGHGSDIKSAREAIEKLGLEKLG